VLARTGVGVDLVDVEAATARGLPVVITPGSGTRAVAEGVFALALHLVKRLGPLTALVSEGRWAQRDGNSIGDLDGATIGIVGYGRIGRRVAEIAEAFGMRVLAHDPVAPPPADRNRPELAHLVAEADVLTPHLMGMSRRATRATFTDAARGVADVLAGRTPHAVANPGWADHHQEEP
jgi:D-3-phosphoglycerate dehydrogenase